MNVLQKYFGQFLGDQFYCGLDIGSHRIKASLNRVVNAHNLELLAVNEAETRGLAMASINDINEFSSCVSAAVNGVARKTKIRIFEVHLGLGGEFVETRPSRALIPLVERGNKIIGPRDLKHARQQARMLGVRLDEEVLCDLVQQFKVDDVNIAVNPVGLFGRKLEVDTLLVLAPITRLRNLTKAVQQAGLEVADVHFNGMTAAELMLDNRQRADGCVFVDLGARLTMIMVFKDGLLKDFRKVPVGGELLTQHIAAELNISFALAEDIKRSYGRVQEGELPEELALAGLPAAAVSSPSAMPAARGEEILIKKEQGFVPIRRDALTRSMEPDIRLITQNIRDAAAASGQEGRLKAGVVVVGGGALLAGLMERIERDTRMPVTLGRNIPGLSSAAIFCVSTSLAERGYKNTLRFQLDSQQPRDWMGRLQARIEEISNEYF